MSLRTLYVDFNSYFASVEQQLQPKLRGQPLGVLPVMTESTCCIAASYEAKAFGIRTGTSVREARKRCPDMIFIEARPALYVQKHHELVAAVESCTPVGKVLSIDEMSCPLMGSEQQRDKALKLAAHIKHTIATRVGEHLRCSIGIAPNTMLAKIASNIQKPDGCTVIEQGELPDRLYPLDLRAIPGIGRAMEKRLARYRITTMRELMELNPDQLQTAWGSIEGRRIHDKLRGREPVAQQSARASVGHSHVMPPELRTQQGVHSVLHRLLQKAAMRLRSYAQIAAAMHVYVKYENRTSWHDDIRFDPTSDTLQLLAAFEQLWVRQANTTSAPMATGISLGSLYDQKQQTRSLFDEQGTSGPSSHDRLNAVIDAVNLRYGRNSLYFAGAHQALAAAPMRIAFQHIPDLDVEAD
jgi:DNA polymerase IV